MQKIDFINNSTPALNATNLNRLQDNMEEAIDDVLENVDNKILDTYSTSSTDTYSCNYVNSVIESGSNSNGNYIKYADGTMICWHTIEGETHANQTRYGDGFFYQQGSYSSTSPENSKSWAYPVQFVSTPTVNLNVSSSAYTMPSLGSISNSSAIGSCITPYAVASVTFTWHFIAIGKWK